MMMGRGGAGTSAAAAVAAALWWMAACAEAVWLELMPPATKCLSEEIQSNVIVIGDYSLLFEEPRTRPTISVKVTSPYGDTLHQKDEVTEGQFAFTTAEAGNYLACFWLDTTEKGLVINLKLDWKIGVAAKDWDCLAKKEKLEGVALELVKLESAVEAVHENLLYLRSKEVGMRDVSERTNARITWLSLMSLSVCIIVSILQLLHLKRYFRKRKLI